MGDECARREERFTEEGLWEWNLTDDRMGFSDAFLARLGVAREEIRFHRQTWEGWLHPEESEFVIEKMEALRAPANRHRYECYHRFRTKSGNWVWFYDRGETIERDESGNPIRVAGVSTEITGPPHDGERSSLPEGSFREAVGTPELGVWDLDLERGRHFWNAAVPEMHGISADKFSEQVEKWIRAIHSNDARKVPAPIRQALENAHSFAEIYRAAYPDGRERWLKALGGIHRGDQGKAGRVSGIVIDVTESHLIARELESSRADLRVTETLAGMGSWAWNCAREEVIWTEGLYALFRMDPREPAPVFAEQYRLYTTESWERLQATVAQCLEDGESYHLDLEAIRSDGTHFFLAARGSAARNKRGQVERLFGTVHDISEQRSAEQRIYQANEELIRANARLQEALKNAETLAYAAKVAEQQRAALLAVMSHEIRTPLNAILGMASLLETTPLNSEQAEYVHTLSSSGHSLAALLNDILDFSKLEARKIVLESRPFSLLDLAHEAVIMFAGMARDKGIELTYQVDAGFLNEVTGDFFRLKQVLANLLSNAVKFTDQGGVLLLLGTKRLDDARIRLKVQVEDTGVGISKGAIDHLFEPFQQADSSITRKFGGTGLGLAISQQLVGLMEGQIHSTSQLGQGSRFEFEVTLASTATAPSFRSLPGSTLVAYLSHSPRKQAMVASLIEYLGTRFIAVDSLNAARKACPELLIIDSSFRDELREVPTEEFRVVEAHPFGEKGFSRFAKLTIPCSIPQLMDCLRQSSPGSAHPLGVLPPAPPALRILVAEDNKINQRVILLMLQKLGYSADVVMNGAEALRELSARPYDLVLMDLQMPDVDGITATHLWRSAEAIGGGRVYICALTANAAESDRERCMEVGMDDYLSKPVVLNQLRDMLERATLLLER